MRGNIQRSKKSSSEKEIEHDILKYLAFQKDVFCWKNQSIGVFDNEIKAYRKNNSPFWINGTADILGIMDGYFLAIEVKKTESAYRSKEQIAFINKINRMGGFSCFVWTVEQVEQFINQTRQSIKTLKSGTLGAVKD